METKKDIEYPGDSLEWDDNEEKLIVRIIREEKLFLVFFIFTLPWAVSINMIWILITNRRSQQKYPNENKTTQF